MCLKKNLVLKYDTAKQVYDKALKKKLEKEAETKVEAYNTWRIAEEKKGRAQDEHGRNLVKIMQECVKDTPNCEPVIAAMSNVVGNVDGKL